MKQHRRLSPDKRRRKLVKKLMRASRRALQRMELAPDRESDTNIQHASSCAFKLLTIACPVSDREHSSSNQHEPHDWRVVAPAMVFSAASILSSIQFLAAAADPRRDQDVSVLLRRLYEHAVDFAWIAINPALNSVAWLCDDYSHRLKADKDLSRLGTSLEPDVRKEFDEFVAAHVRRGGTKELSHILVRVREADDYWKGKLPPIQCQSFSFQSEWSLLAMYPIAHSLGSVHAHPTPYSALQYVLSDSSSGAVSINRRPPGHADPRGYAQAPLVFAWMLYVSSHALSWPSSDEIGAALGVAQR